MLPQERSALFRVALKAFLIDGRSIDLFGSDRPVRIVAVGAGDLAFPDRMMAGALNLGPDGAVALETDLPLHRFDEESVIAVMDGVTVCTGQPFGLMGAAVPEDHFSFLVAFHAGRVDLGHREIGVLTQSADLVFVAPAVDVGGQGSVAGFTGMFGGRCAAVTLLSVNGLREVVDDFRMTRRAGFRADIPLICGIRPHGLPDTEEDHDRKKARGLQPSDKKTLPSISFLHKALLSWLKRIRKCLTSLDVSQDSSACVGCYRSA